MKISLVSDIVEFADELRALGFADGSYAVTELAFLNAVSEHHSKEAASDIIVNKAAKMEPEPAAAMKQLDTSERSPIFFMNDDSSSRTMKDAAEAGVNAFAATDREMTNLRAVFKWSRMQFQIQGRLKEKLQTVETKLADRIIIEQAKGLVMKEQNVDENDAYHMMRRNAMERNAPLRDIARAVINASSLLNKI